MVNIHGDSGTVPRQLRCQFQQLCGVGQEPLFGIFGRMRIPRPLVPVQNTTTYIQARIRTRYYMNFRARSNVPVPIANRSSEFWAHIFSCSDSDKNNNNNNNNMANNSIDNADDNNKQLAIVRRVDP